MDSTKSKGIKVLDQKKTVNTSEFVAPHRYADKVQVVLETLKWSCGTCNNASTFNKIEGHDNAFWLGRHLESIAWFKANYECCAKAGN